MNVEYINPFVASVHSYFANTLKAELTQGALGVSKGEVNPREFAAIVGFNGIVEGIIAMFFPIKTALGITSKIHQKQVVIVDEKVTNAIAEVILKIVKEAKENFPTDDVNAINVTNAEVLRGSEFATNYPGGVWLEMPFNGKLGELKLRVALKKN